MDIGDIPQMMQDEQEVDPRIIRIHPDYPELDRPDVCVYPSYTDMRLP